MSISAIEEPEVVDITIIRGNSFNRTIEVENDDGTPAALSSFRAIGQLLDPETDEILANFTVPDLKDDGKIPIVLKVTDTIGLDPGTYAWALTLVGLDNSDVSTTTIFVGDALVKKVAFQPQQPTSAVSAA